MQLVVTDKQTFTCTKSSASPEDGSFVVKQTSANSGKTNHHNKIPHRENKQNHRSPYSNLVIFFRPCGFLAAKNFWIIRFSIFFISAPDEDFSRNASCALVVISTGLFYHCYIWECLLSVLFANVIFSWLSLIVWRIFLVGLAFLCFNDVKSQKVN